MSSFPDEMRARRDRDTHSSLFGFKDQVSLVSYVPKKNKAVLALSTIYMILVLKVMIVNPKSYFTIMLHRVVSIASII